MLTETNHRLLSAALEVLPEHGPGGFPMHDWSLEATHCGIAEANWVAPRATTPLLRSGTTPATLPPHTASYGLAPERPLHEQISFRLATGEH
jgi:hypothetical protein